MTWAEAYSAARAYQLALCCSHVMEDDMAVRDMLVGKDGGSVRAWFTRSNGTQAALMVFSWGTVLAFRATEIRLTNLAEAFRDIRTDLMFRKVDFLGAKVHRGFLAAYQSLGQELVDALATATPGPLYLTGHSLGGALAQIAAMEIPSERIAAVYTYGAPKVGNRAVDALIGAPLYQFIHAADVVPRVPLTLLGYRSSGDKRYITRRGRVIRSPSGFRMAGRFVWTAVTCPTRLVSDHSLDECYIPPL